MLEIDCVIASLEYKLEIGRTEDDYVIYCKSKADNQSPMSLEELEDFLQTKLSRYGLYPFVIKRKNDSSGNVLFIEIRSF